jgi:hypothetical protein
MESMLKYAREIEVFGAIAICKHKTTQRQRGTESWLLG